MATPTFSEWRTMSTNVKGLRPGDVMTRMMWCLATMATQVNPDGTAKGS